MRSKNDDAGLAAGNLAMNANCEGEDENKKPSHVRNSRPHGSNCPPKASAEGSESECSEEKDARPESET
jgi:hypothetical protein